MKKLLKILLIIILIVCIVLAIAALAAAAVAAPALAGGAGVATSTGVAAGAGAASTAALTGGAVVASTTTAFAGALTPLFAGLGFTSLTNVVMILGGIALAAFITYDLAFKGGKTVESVASSAIKGVKKVWHTATDGFLKPAQRKASSFFGGVKWVIIAALIIGGGYLIYDFTKKEPE